MSAPLFALIADTAIARPFASVAETDAPAVSTPRPPHRSPPCFAGLPPPNPCFAGLPPPKAISVAHGGAGTGNRPPSDLGQGKILHHLKPNHRPYPPPADWTQSSLLGRRLGRPGPSPPEGCNPSQPLPHQPPHPHHYRPYSDPCPAPTPAQTQPISITVRAQLPLHGRAGRLVVQYQLGHTPSKGSRPSLISLPVGDRISV